VLPVLVALFIGATSAGAATILAKPAGINTAAQQAELATSSTYARRLPPASREPATRATQTAGQTSAPSTTTPAPPPASATEPGPTTTTAPPSSVPASSRPPLPDGQTDRVVALVNEARVENGCVAVKVDEKITAAAVAHSADMAARDYFSHTTPEGVTFDKRILAAGYPTPGAENIAQGQDSAEEVMDAWMKSKGHRANILNCQHTTIGVGLDTNGWYWTQDFGY
jgi:uncharacterized protein YkwD